MKTTLAALALAFGLVASVGLTTVARADADTQAPTATITATDEQAVGTAASPPSTKFNTSLFNVSDNVGVTKVECYINDVLAFTDCKNGSDYGVSLDIKDYKNGTYTLSFKLYDAAGNVGQAKTLGGKTKLTFYVTNQAAATPAPSPSPTPSAQTTPACSGKQAAIDRITARIVDRYEKQLDELDGVRDKLASYHDTQSKKLTDFNDLESSIGDKASDTSKAVEDLIKVSTIACNADAKASLEKFKSANALVTEKMREYRLSLLDLVEKLEDL